jgi:hypothetical protein
MMRHFFLFVPLVALAVVAVLAYGQNYRTRGVFAENDALREKIIQSRQRLGVLRAEWAYLNRPDRLRDLVALNDASLQLMPLRPTQFAHVSDFQQPDHDGPERVHTDNIISVAAPLTAISPVSATQGQP